MGKAAGKEDPEMEFYLGALIVIVPGYLLYIHSLIFTPPKRVLGRRNEFGKILKANTIGLLIFGLVLYFGRKEPHLFNFSQRLVVYFYGINVLMITAERNAIRMVLRSMRTRGYNQKHILLVGYSGAAEGFVDRVRSNPQWGYNIRGILDDNRERGSQYDGVKIIGTIDDLGISWSRTPWMRSPLPRAWENTKSSDGSWPYVKRPGSTRNLSRIMGISFPRSPIWKISRVFRSSISAMCP